MTAGWHDAPDPPVPAAAIRPGQRSGPAIPLRITVPVLIALAVWLRLALGNYPFWFDEYASLILADQPLSHLWGPWIVRESNPPLFYTLAKGWHALVGDSFLALRLLPVLGSACSMALLATIARRAFGDRAVVPVLVLYGLSASAIFIGHQFRGYIFCEVGVLLALAGLVEIAGGRGSPLRNHGCYVAGSLLAIYSHSTLLLWPVAATLGMAGWHLLFRRAAWRTVTGRLILADLVLLVLSSWHVFIIAQQLRMGTTNSAGTRSMGLSAYAFHLSQNALLVYFPWSGPAAGPVSRIAKRVMEAVLVLALVRCRQWPAARFLFAMLCAAAAVIGAVQALHPLVTDRTVHWLSVFVVLIVAGALGTIRGRSVRLLALAVPAAALAANLATMRERLVIEDLRQPLAPIDPGTAVVITADDAGTIVFERTCAMQFRLPHCPLTLIALDGRTSADGWAAGMSPVALHPLGTLAAVLPAARPIYTIRYGGSHDPLRDLGRAPGTLADRPALEGPFNRDQLLGRTPLPD